MSQNFHEPHERSGRIVKAELELSNYATKTNLKGVTISFIIMLASKADLFSFKTKLDNLDTHKLKTVPTDLSKLSNIVDNDVVENNVCDKLVIKVTAVDTKNTKH